MCVKPIGGFATIAKLAENAKRSARIVNTVYFILDAMPPRLKNYLKTLRGQNFA